MTDPLPPAPLRRLVERPLLRNHPAAIRIAGVLLLLGGTLFIALAIPSTAELVQRVDDAVYRTMVNLETGPVVVLARVLDFLGSVWVTLPLAAVVTGYLVWHKRWEAFFTWAGAMVLSQLLIGPVKGLYGRPRPLLPLVETTGFSFPSGHAVATGAIAVALAIVLFPAGTARRNTEALAILAVIVMAMSRVYLRAHWMSDALAGAVMGAGIAIVVAALIHVIDEQRAPGDD